MEKYDIEFFGLFKRALTSLTRMISVEIEVEAL